MADGGHLETKFSRVVIFFTWILLLLLSGQKQSHLVYNMFYHPFLQFLQKKNYLDITSILLLLCYNCIQLLI